MKTQSVLLSILLTVVVSLTFYLVCAFTEVAPAHAENESDNSGDGIGVCFGKERDPKLTTQECLDMTYNYNKRNAELTGSSDCATAKKEFNAAKNALGEGDGILEVAIRCIKCKGKNLPPYCRGAGDVKEYAQKTRPKSTPPSSSFRPKSAKRTSVALQKRILACPIVAEKNADRIKDRIEKYEDQVKSLKEDIETTEQDILEQKSKIKEAEDKYKNEDKPRIDKEKESSRKDLDKEYEQNSEAMNLKYKNLGDQLDKLVDDIRELEFQKNNSILAIQRECRNEARKRVLDELQGRKNKLNTNSLSVASQNALLNNRNINKKNSENAVQYYNQCLRYNNDRLESIRADYLRRRESINTAMGKIRQEQAQIIAEIGGQKVQEKYKAELQEIFDNHLQELQRAYEEYIKTTQEAMQKIERLEKKLQEKQVELQEKEDLLANDVRTASMIDQSIADNPAGEDSGAEFIKNFNTYSSAAQTMYTSCGCKEKSNSVENDECKRAMKAICETETSSATGTLGGCDGSVLKTINKMGTR